MGTVHIPIIRNAPSRFDIVHGYKMGPHAVEWYGGPWRTNSGLAPSVCLLSEFSGLSLAEARERAGPNCLIIVRDYIDNQALDNPEQQARWWFEARIDRIEYAHRHFEPCVWQGYNEIGEEATLPS